MMIHLQAGSKADYDAIIHCTCPKHYKRQQSHAINVILKFYSIFSKLSVNVL